MSALPLPELPLEVAIRDAEAATLAVAEAAEALRASPTAPAEEVARLVRERDALYTLVGRLVIADLLAGYTVELGAGVPAPSIVEVEPKTAAPSTPLAPPASSDALLGLQRSFGQRARPERALANYDVDALFHPWGPPDEVSKGSAAAATQALLAAVERIDDWRVAPKEVQQQLLTYAAARTWQVQAARGEASKSQLSPVFFRLNAWRIEHQPGHVHGLAKHHTPLSGSWQLDAQRVWDAVGVRGGPSASAPSIGELIRALEEGDGDKALRQQILALVDREDVDQDHLAQVLKPCGRLLGDDKRLKRLHKRIKRLANRPLPIEDEATDEVVRADWPLLERTRGLRAVMLGGDERQHVCARIQRAFEFASLEWETGWDPRRNAALEARIQGGSVDVVLIVRRFIKHSTTDNIVPTCKSAEVPFIVVTGGYGGAAIRAGFERFWSEA